VKLYEEDMEWSDTISALVMLWNLRLHSCALLEKILQIYLYGRWAIVLYNGNLKGQSHKKVDELRVWGVSLGPN
jgi:hypothetical protein